MTEVICARLTPQILQASRRISVVDWQEDAAQEAWLQVVRVEDEEQGHSLGYLAQTARHAIVSYARRQSHRRMARLETTPDPEHWDMASIELLLGELLPRDRQILVAYMAARGDTSLLGRALRISRRSAQREVRRLQKVVLYRLLGREEG